MYFGKFETSPQIRRQKFELRWNTLTNAFTYLQVIDSYISDYSLIKRNLTLIAIMSGISRFWACSG